MTDAELIDLMLEDPVALRDVLREGLKGISRDEAEGLWNVLDELESQFPPGGD